MISNLVLQDTINGIKNIGRCELTIVDLDGKLVASTEGEPEVSRSDIVNFAESQADSQEIKGSMYFKVYDDYQIEYVVIVTGGEEMSMVGKLAAFQIQNLLVAYKEHFDKDNFIKNLLLDNLLLVDVYNRAMKLHITTNAKRVVYIIESEQSKDYSTLEAVKNLFSKTKNDFITAVDENSIIIIKELKEEDGQKELAEIAESIHTGSRQEPFLKDKE